jgi:hypothetical protein
MGGVLAYPRINGNDGEGGKNGVMGYWGVGELKITEHLIAGLTATLTRIRLIGCLDRLSVNEQAWK